MTEVRRIYAPVRALVAVAAILVTIAGTQLFALADQTDLYFAWTIKPPLTAAFIGAAYWASLFLLLDIVFGATWRQARTGLFSIAVFTTLTLIATLLHLDRFHFGAAEALPRVAAWAWLIVYVTTPVAFTFALWAQIRQPGVDSLRRAVRFRRCSVSSSSCRRWSSRLSVSRSSSSPPTLRHGGRG